MNGGRMFPNGYKGTGQMQMHYTKPANAMQKPATMNHQMPYKGIRKPAQTFMFMSWINKGNSRNDNMYYKGKGKGTVKGKGKGKGTVPTFSPTLLPDQTAGPTVLPTTTPQTLTPNPGSGTGEPTDTPTISPTSQTESPTIAPTSGSTFAPTGADTSATPTIAPTLAPTSTPTLTPVTPVTTSCFIDNDELTSAAADFVEGTTIERDAVIAEFGQIENWCFESALTDFSDVFNGLSAFNDDISGWDMSNVQNIDRMFTGASSFNIDISGWVRNATAFC